MPANDRLLTDDEMRCIYFSTPVAGARLFAVNRILTRWGFEPMPPCTVGEIMNHITPMEMGKYLSLYDELSFVIDRVGEESV